MRVGLDVTSATTGQTGVARYARELTRELRAADVDVVPFAIGRGGFAPPEGTKHLGVPLRLVHRSWRWVGRPRVEDLVGPVDLVHSFDMVPPPTRAPLVMTAMDVMALDRPDLHAPHQVSVQREQLLSWRRAAHVLAISQATADGLTQHGVAAERISVTHLASTPLSEASTCPVDGRFLLAVGEVHARKDLPTLIRAFTAASLPADLRLVLAGPPGYRAEETMELVGGRVIALGKVDDGQLAALYRAASGFCFPSLGEGFGLPLLEAMSAGVPVLASDLAVMREVAGDAAIYAAAGVVPDWSRALERLVCEQDLRAGLIERGSRRVAVTSWQATAAATVAAYRRVLA